MDSRIEFVRHFRSFLYFYWRVPRIFSVFKSFYKISRRNVLSFYTRGLKLPPQIACNPIPNACFAIATLHLMNTWQFSSILLPPACQNELISIHLFILPFRNPSDLFKLLLLPIIALIVSADSSLPHLHINTLVLCVTVPPIAVFQLLCHIGLLWCHLKKVVSLIHLLI